MTAEAAGASASPSPTGSSPAPSSASPSASAAASAGAASEAPGGVAVRLRPGRGHAAGGRPRRGQDAAGDHLQRDHHRGLASRVGGTVSSAGWTLGPLGNWSGARQQSSVIFYSGEAQKGNAEALGLLLGIPTMVQSAEFNVPLVVVLGPGFQ